MTALIGPSAQIIVPKVAQPVEKHFPDYEVELIVIIGKPAKNVPEAQALDYILAYTCGNDVSHVAGTVIVGPLIVCAGIVPLPPNDYFTVGLFERFR